MKTIKLGFSSNITTVNKHETASNFASPPFTKKVRYLLTLYQKSYLLGEIVGYFTINRINNKILDCDWSSARLFSHVIGARSRGCPITAIQLQLSVIG